MKRRAALFFILISLSILHSCLKPERAVKDVSPEQAHKIIKDSSIPDLVILDVRTPQEFSLGHIPGAVNIDFFSDDFSQKVQLLDKSATYLLHCKSGGRSTRTLQFMLDHGIKKIYHMSGGFNAWSSLDLPIIQDTRK